MLRVGAVIELRAGPRGVDIHVTVGRGGRQGNECRSDDEPDPDTTHGFSPTSITLVKELEA
jgi:hypothetical protein